MIHLIESWVELDPPEPLYLRLLRRAVCHPVQVGLALSLLAVAVLPPPTCRDGSPAARKAPQRYL